MIKIVKIGLVTSFLFWFIFPSIVFGQEIDNYVTIVNPVRISRYTEDISINIATQYKQIKMRDLSATWLLTYDVLDSPATEIIKEMDGRQEIGLFLEVGPHWAQEAGVQYNKTDSWHRANSVFLSGYTQEERVRLIDELFVKFEDVFGYYPVSVGSWWTDSYSLGYMQEKYGVMANLGVSDQFETDGYQIWGTYWSTPYYSSRKHLGIPVSKVEDKLDVVNLQWAPREIARGYESSLYSTQDYKVVGEDLDTDYFEELVRTYGFSGKNEFGQVVVGLEGDLSPGVYEGEYAKQLDVVERLTGEGLEDVTMSEFAGWYGDRYEHTPPQIYEQDGVVWYQSDKYRVGVRFTEGKVYIFDLRVYTDDFIEPYYKYPNGELDLSVYIPAVLDEKQNKDLVWEFEGERDDIVFEEDKLVINKIFLAIPANVKKSGLIDVGRTFGGIELIPKDKFLVGEDGYTFNDLSVITRYFLKGKKNIASLFLGKNWDQISLEKYWVSQSEMDVLRVLASSSGGAVLVYDQECLGCEWSSEYQPAVFANRRGYVRKFGGKRLVRNQKVFEALNQEESLLEFEKTGAKYIYLVKYGSEIEKLPFQPGDLRVERLYENANAVLFEVK